MNPTDQKTVQRTAVHLASSTDLILDGFFSAFANIRAELALGTSLQTAINTEYILNKVNKIGQLIALFPNITRSGLTHHTNLFS